LRSGALTARRRRPWAVSYSDAGEFCDLLVCQLAEGRAGRVEVVKDGGPRFGGETLEIDILAVADLPYEESWTVFWWSTTCPRMYARSKAAPLQWIELVAWRGVLCIQGGRERDAAPSGDADEPLVGGGVAVDHAAGEVLDGGFSGLPAGQLAERDLRQAAHGGRRLAPFAWPGYFLRRSLNGGQVSFGLL
jgi:hypothetical protein